MTAVCDDVALKDLILTQGDYRQLSGFVSATSGIKLPPSKKAMVEGRLRRRLRNLGFSDFASYCRYVFEAGGLAQEGVHIIDAVTTNKTEFFREPEHFRVLATDVLPRLLPPGRGRPLKAWSAACSSGAEPYSIAMVLADYMAVNGGPDFQVTATDLCTEVLKIGAIGIYPDEAAEPVPAAMRRRHLLRSRERSECKIRIAPELRAKVSFMHLNLMDANYPVKGPFDIIFCRNVLIYFERKTQAEVLRRLCGHLAADGYLFLGHSETIAGYNLPLRSVAPTVFIRA
jgi:chemotaxis protein methyltransferase CheR